VYLDEMIVGGRTKQERDFNAHKFKSMCEKENLVQNPGTSIYRSQVICVLLYRIVNHLIGLVPELMESLLVSEFPEKSKGTQVYISPACMLHLLGHHTALQPT